MALLRRIEGPVWSVTSNHDVNLHQGFGAFSGGRRGPQLVARQQSMGWNVLEDTTVYLRRGADGISLTGLSFDPALRANARHDRPAGHERFRRLQRYSVRSTTSPSCTFAALGTDRGGRLLALTLVGNVHSMQFKSALGPRIVACKWIYKHWSSRYDTGRHTMSTTARDMLHIPMRLGAWPEVTLFTLKL